LNPLPQPFADMVDPSGIPLVSWERIDTRLKSCFEHNLAKVRVTLRELERHKYMEMKSFVQAHNLKVVVWILLLF